MTTPEIEQSSKQQPIEYTLFVNGRDIRCFRNEPQDEPKGYIVVSHGNLGNPLSGKYEAVTQRFVAGGYTVVRYGQPDNPFIGSAQIQEAEITIPALSFDAWVATLQAVAKPYGESGKPLVFFGNSMGATASIVAAASTELSDKVSGLLLWVPDTKDTYSGTPGQMTTEYRNEDGRTTAVHHPTNYWIEAREQHALEKLRLIGKRMKQAQKPVHIVYGEQDDLVRSEVRQSVIDLMQELELPVTILPGENHGKWSKDSLDKVVSEELALLS